MPEQPFLLPGELRTAIASYLAHRPYVEVAALIQALHQLQPVQGEAPPSAGVPGSQRPGQKQPDTSSHYKE